MLTTILYPADQRYTTPQGTWENKKVVSDKPVRLVNLYAFNSGGDKVYVGVIDTPDGNVANATRAIPYPVESGSFISIAVPVGQRIEGQLVVQAFTDATLSTAAGNVMFWNVEYMAYL